MLQEKAEEERLLNSKKIGYRYGEKSSLVKGLFTSYSITQSKNSLNGQKVRLIQGARSEHFNNNRCEL